MSTHFAKAAKKAFTFLEGIGFRLTESGPIRLLYESANAFVTIEWQARSGELNVYLGPQPRTGDVHGEFSLKDLLSMEDVKAPERNMPFQVADERKLQPFLEIMAKDVRSHAQAALAGDRMYFRRLEAFRNTQAKTYMKQMDIRRVRAEAHNAWKRRELDKLIKLYASIEDQLTTSEKAKLAYARQHQAN